MADSRTLRSSKRRKISEQTSAKDEASHPKASIEPEALEKREIQHKLRSSSRLKVKTQQEVDVPEKPARSSRTVEKVRVEGSKTVTKETKVVNVKRLRPASSVSWTRQSKRTNKNTADNTIWDIPDEDVEGPGNPQEKEQADESLPSDSQSQVESIDTDSLAIQAQLQLELATEQISDISTARPQEDAPYVAELRTFCKKNGLEGMIATLAKYILERINGQQLIPLRGLTNEYQTVYQLMEQTVLAGEGNSMLLLGARGCGKTAVIETALASLAKDHKDDFHIVRLNGFLHTDDKIALREIWHQLGRELNVDEDLSKPSTYADTMASLLALLSEVPVDSTTETMTTTKAVVIILDEFDLFTYHPRQTLLYNLFDIAQAKKAPLAVIGLTTKVDVMENLEKRVKSRFSHRYTFLPQPQTFNEFSEICMAALKVDLEESRDQCYHSGAVKSMLQSPKGRLLCEHWNTYLQGLWADQHFQPHLKTIFYRTKSPRDFFASALLPISNLILSSSHSSLLMVPTAKSFNFETLCPDPAPFPFPTTSATSTSTISLPLSLLLAATRLTALHDPGLKSAQMHAFAPLTLTFPAVFAEYVRLLTSAKASASAQGATATPGRVWGKDAAREAWEKLVGWGLVAPTSGGSGIGDGRMFRVEISFEDVVDGMGPGGAGALGRWWRDG